jgi:uncharacterized membrane protein
VGINFNKILYTYLTNIVIPKGCHQLPERSFFYKNNQYPVCARCTGVAVGQLFGIITTAIILYIRIKYLIYLTILLSTPMCIDWSVQYFFQIISTNKRRLISGILCGIGFGALYLAILHFIIKMVLSIF